jgi:hypothetical protein
LFELLSDFDDEGGSERIGRFEALRGFFDRPALPDDDDPADVRMSFGISGLRAEAARSGRKGWPQSLTEFQIGIANIEGQTIGVYSAVAAAWDEMPGEGESAFRVSGLVDPYPTAGADVIWERWARALPAERNEWAVLAPPARKAWLEVVGLHAFQAGDKVDKSGPFILDGSAVTDEAGFYCAIGEAVNGPGGYFGWRLSAVDDCFRGGWGAAPRCTIYWDHSRIARESLTETFMTWLEEIALDHGVTLILR